MRKDSGGVKTLAKRFWSKVDKLTSPEGCWIWTAGKNMQGYGKIDSKRAHRIAWEIINGSIPSGLLVCHHCDNPSCVNPLHLFTGTRSDNALDSVNKGRWNRPLGENHPKAKLTANQVLEIREAPYSQRKLAHLFGVSRAAIRQVLSGRAWSHVQNEGY